MSWYLTVGIKEFLLTDQEKEFYLKAVDAGEEHIQIKRGLYVGPNYQSLVEANVDNPILNSPTYIELISLSGQGDNLAVRRKMALEQSIDRQFPYDRYSKEWEEIRYPQNKNIVLRKE